MNFLSSLHNKSLGLLLIRIALGIVFIYHGWAKVSDIDTFIARFATLDINAFFTYVVAYVELIGGILMILGVRVREVALLFVVTMLVAIYKVHLGKEFGGMEYQVTLLLASLAVIFTGAGKYSLLSEKRNCGMCKDGTCACK